MIRGVGEYLVVPNWFSLVQADYLIGESLQSDFLINVNY